MELARRADARTRATGQVYAEGLRSPLWERDELPKEFARRVGVEAGVEVGCAADLIAAGRDRHDERGVVEELWRARERRSNSARRSE